MSTTRIALGEVFVAQTRTKEPLMVFNIQYRLLGRPGRERLASVWPALLATAIVAATASPARASRYLRVGFFDQSQTVFGE
ncbi:MAG: hypothetical protein ACTHK7_02145, partial [Aureliella sp.]